ncbi:unnamed protein product [Cyberlindnera jadinii]|uniref:Uncharacterized protein n=1 Tax=Cyberlindnera jadinii (strain ATCC 18201 / CBS 1600 / BCRC 20928 / JCM 3617 / NBRC 0987 / NRRL Y-1542) TaxID=983966 RepID=A0A0H5CFL8_CYBJN|nr:unnamed protein product [Cyberlindnera jadinii]
MPRTSISSGYFKQASSPLGVFKCEQDVSDDDIRTRLFHEVSRSRKPHQGLGRCVLVKDNEISNEVSLSSTRTDPFGDNC